MLGIRVNQFLKEENKKITCVHKAQCLPNENMRHLLST